MGKHDRHGDFTKNMRSYGDFVTYGYMAVCQNLVPLVNIKIAGKWMFIPLKMVLIGIDPYPYIYILYNPCCNFLSRIEGAGTPKTFDSGEPSCTPTLLQKSKTMGWQAPKNNPFLTFLDCILVGS